MNTLLDITSCTNCSDTYEIPQGMDLDKETICHRCKDWYIPAVRRCEMPRFAFEALKRVKGEK